MFVYTPDVSFAYCNSRRPFLKYLIHAMGTNLDIFCNTFSNSILYYLYIINPTITANNYDQLFNFIIIMYCMLTRFSLRTAMLLSK